MICGLLGEKLGHSYSPRIHRALGDYSYGLFEVSPEKLEDFLLHGDFDGLNVTIPYKKAVMPYCQVLSPRARAIGSVNTLVRRADGSLYGDNTDYDGFSWLLARNCGIKVGEKALVLGNGGASLTVQTVLKELGAEVVVISRRGENGYDSIPRHADATLLVNTTPVGMYPQNGERLVDLGQLPKLRCVLDLIYNPARTRLLLDAEERGIVCEGGLPMLVAQAKRASELFTGKSIDGGCNNKILCQLEREMQNIILIGMPGCGKSTVGKCLAEQLGRPLYDADGEIVKAIGCSIPDFFAKEGEVAFRRVETEVLAELGKKSGCIIATGGGCVTRPENYPLLHQNGKLIWLQRDITRLPKDGRPISQRTDLQSLYEARKACYERFCDIMIENDRTLQETARQILAKI